MEELKKLLMEKVGLAQAEADKVGTSLTENAGEVAKAVSEGEGPLTQLLEKLGLGSIAGKVAAFLAQHAGELPKLLGASPEGLVDKAKGVLGGLLGGKE